MLIHSIFMEQTQKSTPDALGKRSTPLSIYTCTDITTDR